MNPFKMYQTDPELEAKGVDIDYGDFYFTVARAGGGNKRFTERLADAFKPYKRSIQTDTVDYTVLDRITQQVFIETCLKGWGSQKHGAGKMLGPNDEAIEFSQDAAKEFFAELPALLEDLIAQANKLALYRVVVAEDDIKN